SDRDFRRVLFRSRCGGISIEAEQRKSLEPSRRKRQLPSSRSRDWLTLPRVAVSRYPATPKSNRHARADFVHGLGANIQARLFGKNPFRIADFGSRIANRSLVQENGPRSFPRSHPRLC